MGLNSGFVTDLLQYDKPLHSKIICKTSGYRSNYNLQELNLICEHPQLCSRPGPHRRSVCVVPNREEAFTQKCIQRGRKRRR